MFTWEAQILLGWKKLGICFLLPVNLPCKNEKWKWNSLSRVRLFVTPRTIQSMKFSRPKYWSRYPFPSLGDRTFPTQGSNPGLPHCRILYQLSHKGSPRILEWVAYPFSKGSSQPRNRTGVSCLVDGFFTNWAIRKAIIKTLGGVGNKARNVWVLNLAVC